MDIDSNAGCVARDRSPEWTAWVRFVLGVLALTGVVACAGKAQESHALSGDATVASSADASLPLDAGELLPSTDASDAAAVSGLVGPDGGSCVDEDGGQRTSGITRVPVNHRSGPSSCPTQRAAINADAGYTADAICTGDSDCTAGPNGRCGSSPPGSSFASPVVALCSYDQCFTDLDCEGGLPCDCRTSSASPSPNVCSTGGDCSVDSDCGPGGYCSPSYESCVLRYECHTACDRCLDDSDCGDGGDGVGCNYLPGSGIWACSSDCPTSGCPCPPHV